MAKNALVSALSVATEQHVVNSQNDVAQRTPFYVAITTQGGVDKDVMVDHRIVDIGPFKARQWLGNHHLWAADLGHSVEVHRATSDEVTKFMDKQKVLLSRRYGK